MDATTLGISFLGILAIYGSYLNYSVVPEMPRPIFPFGQETGKTKQIQSRNGDASMATELRRRQAIQQVGRLSKIKIKESRTMFGSTTGAIETFMISSLCPSLPCCPADIIFDGGNQTSDFCPILDDQGAGTVYDGGNQDTKACGV